MGKSNEDPTVAGVGTTSGAGPPPNPSPDATAAASVTGGVVDTVDQQHEAFVLLENERKSNNLGPLLRCACAFGVQTIVAVGYDKCAVEGTRM